MVAAPAFQEITRGALALLGEPSPFDVHRRMAWIDPDDLAKRRAAETDKTPDLKSAAAPVDPFYAGDVPVPDFGGLTMDQVLRSASNVGLRVRLAGSGTAVAQDISPLTRTPAWSTVSVHFEPRTPGVVLTPTIEAAQIELPAVEDGSGSQGGLL